MKDSLYPQNRKSVRQRDNGECYYCGMTNEQHKQDYDQSLHVHHIVPQRVSGSDHSDNLITVCNDCHTKLEHTQAEALANLTDTIVKRAVDELEPHDENDMVQKDCYYILSGWRIARVVGFSTEDWGATVNGVVENVSVDYKRFDRDDNITYTVPINEFLRKPCIGPYKQVAELPEERTGRIERQLEDLEGRR